jgi:hypothetical protein
MGFARRGVRRSLGRASRSSVRGVRRPVRYVVPPRPARQTAHTVRYPIEAALRPRRRGHGGWLLLGGTGAAITMLVTPTVPCYWPVLFWLAVCAVALVKPGIRRHRRRLAGRQAEYSLAARRAA